METHSFEDFNVATSEATNFGLINQASHTMKDETFMFNHQSLQNSSQRISVNLEDGLIHTKDEPLTYKSG